MTESGREQFEKWFHARYPTCPLGKSERTLEYMYVFTGDQWRAWQAAFEAGRGGWISVEDELPQDKTGVLAFFDGEIRTLYFLTGGFWDYGAYSLRRYPKFWQPPPAPPDSGDKKGTE